MRWLGRAVDLARGTTCLVTGGEPAAKRGGVELAIHDEYFLGIVVDLRALGRGVGAGKKSGDTTVDPLF